tara:strand:+ start:286 stop:684 length:399 start_codon:yes stop_codon:yes gene_type:complete
MTDYSSFLQQKARIDSAKQAGVRCAPMWLLHLFTLPPVVSVVYASKTNNWAPTLWATGVALIGVPLAVFDLGLTFAVAPPVTSAVLFTTAATRKRNELGIVDPLQADAVIHQVTVGAQPTATQVTGNVTIST